MNQPQSVVLHAVGDITLGDSPMGGLRATVRGIRHPQPQPP